MRHDRPCHAPIRSGRLSASASTSAVPATGVGGLPADLTVRQSGGAGGSFTATLVGGYAVNLATASSVVSATALATNPANALAANAAQAPTLNAMMGTGGVLAGLLAGSVSQTGTFTSGNDGIVTTLAGTGVIGFNDGPVATAQFYYDARPAVGPDGTVYVSDLFNHVIRTIKNGTVATLAGTADAPGLYDGIGTSALFNGPADLVVDPTGTYLYIAEDNNNVIRRVAIANGATQIFAGSAAGTAGFADGTGTAAAFYKASGIAIDAAGTNLYVVDSDNCSIRKIVIATAAVTTIAGNGPGSCGFADGTGTAAQFNTIGGGGGIAVSGNIAYIGDGSNNRIRALNVTTGAVTTVAGSGSQGLLDGTGTAAELNGVGGVAVDASGNLYTVEYGNNDVRKINLATGAVTTLAGGGASLPGFVDGAGTGARISGPTGLAIDASGTLYFGDASGAIRTIR